MERRSQGENAVCVLSVTLQKVPRQDSDACHVGTPDWQWMNTYFAPAGDCRQSSGDELLPPRQLCLSQTATPVAILDASTQAQAGSTAVNFTQPLD
ncbi:hypothetical protein EMIT0P100_230020 [Pseudomonas sp. IT-P100]